MSFISRLHADLRAARLHRRGATHDPKDVPTGLHKSYSRMEQIKLPEPAPIAMPFHEILETRTSFLGGGTSKPISLEAWGTLLGHALRKREGSTHRNYPSGGGLYPIETYLITRMSSVDTFTAFHYNPTRHSLEKLWDLSGTFEMKQLISVRNEMIPSSLIIFTSVWKRSARKYGDFAYILSLLEVGHVSQNILLLATALGLESRPFSAFSDEKITEELDLNSETEQPLLTIGIT